MTIEMKAGEVFTKESFRENDSLAVYKPFTTLIEYPEVFADHNPEVMDAVVACAQSAFGPDLLPKSIIRRMRGNVSILLDAPDKVIGVAVSRFENPREYFKDNRLPSELGLYLAFAAVRSEYQNRGLHRALNYIRLQQALEKKIDIVFMQTQNPTVYRSIVASLQALVEAGKIASFTQGTFLRQGAYGRQVAPLRHNPVQSVSPFDSLDFSNGDAIVFVFHISYEVSHNRTS